MNRSMFHSTIRSMLCVVVLLASLGVASAADADIRLNSLGFLPTMPKRATIVAECAEFTVKRASDNEVLFSGKATGPLSQQDVGQTVWVADFSALRQAGKCYLDVPGVGRSAEFEIGEKVYDSPYVTAMRGFYLWRCGMAVEGDHQGNHYAHAACHLDDAYQDHVGVADSRRDGTGGWHDAGDYGKYTVNAGCTVGMLFMAWDHFGDRLKDVSLSLPDTAPGYPDFLKELKWETDWLLKMPLSDGSGRVSHKLTRLDFSGFVMPETDTEKRYYTDWGSAATADFVAMMAMAARYFKPYDAEYAEKCLAAAKTSYQFLKENPADKRPNLSGFSTGGYGTTDPDDRLWAAAEMWETTGEAEYLADFEQRATTPAGGGRMRGFGGGGAGGKIDADWDWGNVRTLGMVTYLTSQREGRDPELRATIEKDLLAAADSIVAAGDRDVYARPMGSRYYWGCNGTVARQTLVLQVANKISPKPEYVATALDAVGHLFGRNVYGRSFVTGLGHLPPMNPHDRRSGADEVEAPWPGYLVGGPQRNARSWRDVEEDYENNEIAINWQAALVYALAGFVSEPAE